MKFFPFLKLLYDVRDSAFVVLIITEILLFTKALILFHSLSFYAN